MAEEYNEGSQSYCVKLWIVGSFILLAKSTL